MGDGCLSRIPPRGAQGLIDPILRIEACDILIGIFWKRFGTPVTDAQSGTEHEFRLGYEAWKRAGRPHIMVYFNQRSYAPKTREETDQWGQVLDFQRNFPQEGLWWPYRGRAQFERLVRNHLTQFLRQQGTAPSDVRRQLELMRSSHLDARERVAAGNSLAQQGDPRLRTDAWYLLNEPLLGFVEIPAGPFLMGSHKAHDAEASDDELPQHEVTLPRYFISRYPVAVAQFRAFVEGGGCRPENPESLQGLANHPVVSVSWHEARQYCEWLTERLRAWPGTPEPLATLIRNESWQVDLPSEAEWEKAARGTDGRIYPWGNEPDPNRADYVDTGIISSSAVGCFPGGASLYGVEDLSGNVWEWTRSLWGGYPYPADQQERTRRENLRAHRDIRRVLRGGTFHYIGRRYVRCASRYGDFPINSFWYLGFRVVVRPAF